MADKKDTAWAKIFDELNLDQLLHENGIATVTADQIKKISKEEPRLMAKWDERDSRPAPLKRSNSTILPVSNGEYRLIAADGYIDLPDSIEPNLYKWPNRKNYQTLPENLHSESQVIDACVASKLLHAFVEEDDLLLTVRGRLRSPEFTFGISDHGGRSHAVVVNGVQVELDAGFEGAERFYIIESKLSAASSLIVRQLYYPYRMWHSRGVTKPIVPLYIGYSNKTVTLIEYSIPRPEQYGPLHILQHKRFVFDDTPPDLSLADLVNKIKPSNREPDGIPFPQADNLARVIDTIDLVSRGFTSKEDISEAWAYDERQGDYYSNAAVYLGMLKREGRNGFSLTENGRYFSQLSARQRIQLLAEQALKHPVFYESAASLVKRDACPDLEQISEWIAYYSTLSGTTPRRRAVTVLNWLRRFMQDLSIL